MANERVHSQILLTQPVRKQWTLEKIGKWYEKNSEHLKTGSKHIYNDNQKLKLER